MKPNFYKNNKLFVNDYVNGKIKRSYAYSPKQFKALNFSLLVAGVGFLLTFLVALIVYYTFPPSLNLSNWFIGAAVGLFLVGAVLEIVWNSKVYKAPAIFGISVIFLNILVYGVLFGLVFRFFGITKIALPVLMVSLIFIAAFAISKLLSFKTILSFRRLVYLVFFIAGFLIMFFSLLYWFVLADKNILVFIDIVVNVVFGLLAVWGLLYNLWAAQQIDAIYANQKIAKKVALFIGFEILSNVLFLLFIIFTSKRHG